MIFGSLSPDREPTRAVLHTYSQAAIAINRAHGIAHPQWWHVSLKISSGRLVADPVPLPDGGSLEVSMDFVDHSVVVATSEGDRFDFSMRDGLTGSEMGDLVTGTAQQLGLDGPFDRSKFESHDPTSYDASQARSLMAAFVDVNTVFERHRVGLGMSVSPIQVWPHGFDLSFEWFGTKVESHEGQLLPTQLNLGFYPKGDAYFYSSPWPFDDELREVPLPDGARWHADGWHGAMLPYDAIAGDPAAARRISEFARAVFDAAYPSLTV